MQRVADRLEGVGMLAGRVHGAAKYDVLRATNQLGQISPAAYVVPAGIRGGRADAIAGMFRQEIERVVGVVLVYRHVGDATGAKGVETIEPLIEDVIRCVCGWAPDDVIGIFRLSRGEPLGMLPGGLIIYQLDFAVGDQLRIA